MNHEFRQGNFPLLVSIPHNGSHIPESIAASMTEHGKGSRDTDWFLDRLYDVAELSDASLLVAKTSRYVIDLNRSQSNENLYPGQTTTGLIPQERFDGQPIWNSPPNADDIARRVDEVWKPYHTQIETELDRLRQTFGIAVLIEAHSIESQLPRLFEGRLPDFNIGTNEGKSCSSGLSAVVTDVLEAQTKYTHVLNGRFVGGHITRHFGNPSSQQHSIQFELVQDTYMDETNKVWNEEKANQVQPVIRNIIARIKAWLKMKLN